MERAAWVAGELAAGRKGAGWAVSAIAESWDVPADRLAEIRERERRHRWMLSVLACLSGREGLDGVTAEDVRASARAMLPGQREDRVRLDYASVAGGAELVIAEAHDPRFEERIRWSGQRALAERAHGAAIARRMPEPVEMGGAA